MVRTDNYSRNASDSLSNVTHVTSSLGVLFMFLVFWELIGWFGQVVCWFVFFPPPLETGFGAVFRSSNAHLCSFRSLVYSMEAGKKKEGFRG